MTAQYAEMMSSIDGASELTSNAIEHPEGTELAEDFEVISTAILQFTLRPCLPPQARSEGAANLEGKVNWFTLKSVL
jgi:hypothetical protein